MSKKNKNITEDSIEKIEESLSKTEQYIEDNKKSLSIIITIIVVIVAGFLLYKNFYLAPKEQEAKAAIWKAQYYFEKDSFRLALDGDGVMYDGFLAVAENYGMTSAGNLANYYAGLCYLKLGEYANAIEYLSNFDTSNEIIAPIAKGATGDANLEMGNKEEALKLYLAAAESSENELTAPVYLMKAGLLYEDMEKKDKALETYSKIKSLYKKSQQGQAIDKYIERLK